MSWNFQIEIFTLARGKIGKSKKEKCKSMKLSRIKKNVLRIETILRRIRIPEPIFKIPDLDPAWIWPNVEKFHFFFCDYYIKVSKIILFNIAIEHFFKEKKSFLRKRFYDDISRCFALEGSESGFFPDHDPGVQKVPDPLHWRNNTTSFSKKQCCNQQLI